MTNLAVQRRQNWSKLVRTVTKVKESGKIDQHLDLIAGLPHEDYDTFRKTFNDVFALRPEELQLGFLKMLRGTGLRRDAEKYGYVYAEQAPYEMLGNDLMPFSDLIRIKRVEDVLEKYWNAHRMDHTLLYLIDTVFGSAFDFFQLFGDYWERQGWERIGHQLEDLFSRLWAYLSSDEAPASFDRDVVLGLMKYDYFLGHNHKPRKVWWEFSMDKQELGSWMRRLGERPEEVSPRFAELGLGEKELQKHAVLERLPFDLLQLLQTGIISRDSETLLVMLYGAASGHTRGGSPHMLTLSRGEAAVG